MFDQFNNIISEAVSFYDLPKLDNKKGHEHRHEKDSTLFNINPYYERKHLNLVPEYVKKTQDTATEKIRSLNYNDNTSSIIDKFEAARILKKYGIKLENIMKRGEARLGRSKTIIKYNPMYGNFTLIKKEQEKKDDE